MAFVANDVFKRTLFRIFILALALSWNFPAAAQNPAREHRGHRPLPALAGRVVSADSSAVHSATVYLKGTHYGCTTDDKGFFRLHAPAGAYELIVSAVGFEPSQTDVVVGHKSRSTPPTAARSSCSLRLRKWRRSS